MTRLTVRWTQRALRRLDQVGTYIAADNPDAAAKVVARIIGSVNALADHPGMGRAGRIKGTRELVFADIPYIVPYRVVRNEVQVLSVIHAAQLWPEGL